MTAGDENLLLYVNLAGELFYIIVHRMGSQGIRYDLQKRVYDDLSLVICNPQVIQDLLVGKINLISYSLTELKMMLSSIVHSSIMNINDYSMEKLFELTLIATKYQYSVCPNPSHVLLIALNHVDSMRKHLTDPLSVQSAENLHFVLVEAYSVDGADTHGHDLDGFISPVNATAMKRYQDSILNYMRDVRLKMTNLIKLGLQTHTGEFEIDPVSKQFKDVKVTPAMLELYGDRKTHLGMSIYEMQVEPGTVKHHSLTQAQKAKRKPVTTRRASEPSPTATAASGPGMVIPNSTNTAAGGSSSKSKSKLSKDGRSSFDVDVDSDANQILKAIQGLDLCGTLLGCNLEAGGESKIVSKVPTGVEGLKASSTGVGAGAGDGKINTKSGHAALSEEFNVVRIDAAGARAKSGVGVGGGGSGNNHAMSEIVKQLDLDLDLDSPTRVDSDGEDNEGGARVRVLKGTGSGGNSSKYSGARTTAQLLELAMDSNEYN